MYYDFQARNSSELSVKEWDILEVRGEGGGGERVESTQPRYRHSL